MSVTRAVRQWRFNRLLIEIMPNPNNVFVVNNLSLQPPVWIPIIMNYIQDTC